MSGHMDSKLALDMLYAEANLHANNAMRLLLERELSAALIEAERWSVVQDEIAHHLDNAKRGQA